MTFRTMRILLSFDLPMEKSDEKRAYRHFVKHLESLGFVRFQKSVFFKLCLDQQAADSVLRKVRDNLPEKGDVMAIQITEKQFQKTVYFLGERTSDVITNDERIIDL